MPEKILLFKLGALGDVLMTTPLIRQLRKSLPDAELVYYVGKHAAPILKNNKYLDKVETFDDFFYSKNIFKAMSLRRKITKEKFDVAFVLDKHKVFSLFIKLCKIPVRIGFDRMGKEGGSLTHKVYFDGSKHEIKYYLELGEKAGLKIDEKNTRMDIFMSKRDEDFAANIFRRNKIKTGICIAPGGANNPGQSAHIKIWPKENFVKLCSQLSMNNKIILVGDKNDIVVSKYIKNAVKSSNIIDITGKATVQQTAAIMKRCKKIICNDTGPMHIASAVNKYIISIFGPTDPRRFAPLHKESRVLWKHVNGTPCNDIYGSFKNCGGRNYTDLISVSDVLNIYEKSK